jgi:hypothetical protein
MSVKASHACVRCIFPSSLRPQATHPAQQLGAQLRVVRHHVCGQVQKLVGGGRVEQQEVGEGLGGERPWVRLFFFLGGGLMRCREGCEYYKQLLFTGGQQRVGRMQPQTSAGNPPSPSRWLSFLNPPPGSDCMWASAELWRVTGSSSSSDLRRLGGWRLAVHNSSQRSRACG